MVWHSTGEADAEQGVIGWEARVEVSKVHGMSTS